MNATSQLESYRAVLSPLFILGSKKVKAAIVHIDVNNRLKNYDMIA